MDSLSQGLGVGTRTIRRLFKELEDNFGAKIQYNRTYDGYEYAKQPSSLDRYLEGVHITERDRVRLALAAKALEFLDLKEEATGLRQWIKQVTGESLKLPLKELDRVISYVEERPTLVLHNDLAQFLEAIIRRYPVEFSYKTRYSGRSAMRRVDPYHLTHREAAWYLVGFAHEHQALRTYALVRMGRIRLFKKHAFPLPDFDPVAYFRDSGIIQTEEKIKVHLRFNQEAASRLNERHLRYDFLKPPWTDAKGHLHLRFYASSEEGLMPLILRFGADVKVISPRRLQNRVRDALEAAWGQYH